MCSYSFIGKVSVLTLHVAVPLPFPCLPTTLGPLVWKLPDYEPYILYLHTGIFHAVNHREQAMPCVVKFSVIQLLCQ